MIKIKTRALDATLPLKQRLQRLQKIKKVNWEIVELDYTLSWVLAAVGQEQEIRENLIFKGGTCLKKCYFGERYRYSQDLDFTTSNVNIADQKLDGYIDRIVILATQLSNNFGNKIDFIVEHYKESQPHPFNQKAYTVRARLPWQRTPLTKIKFEISRDEKILTTPNELSIIHEYGEKFSQKIKAYALEEILAEKYRGILQNQERLKERTWIRSRVRDFYDLWCILTHFNQTLKIENFPKNFMEKCKIKNIKFTGIQQFFSNKDYLTRIQKDWGEFLGVLVADLPNFEELIRQLEPLTKQLFSSKK